MTPPSLLSYDWLLHLVTWRDRRQEGETRNWELTHHSRRGIKCRLSWRLSDATIYNTTKCALSAEHAVSLALEEFDTWMAKRIMQQRIKEQKQEQRK